MRRSAVVRAFNLWIVWRVDRVAVIYGAKKKRAQQYMLSLFI